MEGGSTGGFSTIIVTDQGPILFTAGGDTQYLVLEFDRFSILRSDDPKKGWRFEYSLIFSTEGLVNINILVS